MWLQVTGEWVMPLQGYNSITPYASMNSHCGSQWPSYDRCPGGGTACEC